MSDKKVETIDLSDSSTSLEVALMEALGSGTHPPEDDVGSNHDQEEQNNPEPSNTSKNQESNASDNLLKGVTTDTTETEPDENITDEPVHRETLFFFQIEDKTTSATFRPEDPEEEGRGFPLKSSGQIDSILIDADTNTFRVTLDIDNDKVIDGKSWTELNNISQELAHIGAYQRTSGEFVLHISDYPFNKRLDLSIRATDETTFNFIRAEVMLDEFSKGNE